jgi:hypothetical protein
MRTRPVAPPGPSQPVKAADTPALSGLVAQARLLDLLDHAVRAALPAPLASQCRLVNTRQSRLILLANSPTVAARLRLMRDTLLDHASRVSGRRYDELTVKVGSPAATVASTPPAGKPLSPLAADHLRRAASFLEDPQLADLLRRLASLAD